jgi:hypothetical protein
MFVDRVEKKAGMLGFSSPKITLYLHAMACAQVSFVRLSFTSDGRDEFFKELQSTLERSAWKVVETVATVPAKKREFDPTHAGVHGILRSVATRNANADRSIDIAFQDLSALMKCAADVVDLAQKFSAAQLAQSKAGGVEEHDVRFDDLLVNLGFFSCLLCFHCYL